MVHLDLERVSSASQLYFRIVFLGTCGGDYNPRYPHEMVNCPKTWTWVFPGATLLFSTPHLCACAHILCMSNQKQVLLYSVGLTPRKVFTRKCSLQTKAEHANETNIEVQSLPCLILPWYLHFRFQIPRPPHLLQNCQSSICKDFPQSKMVLRCGWCCLYQKRSEGRRNFTLGRIQACYSSNPYHFYAAFCLYCFYHLVEHRPCLDSQSSCE